MFCNERGTDGSGERWRTKSIKYGDNVCVTQTFYWINFSEFLFCKCEESTLWSMRMMNFKNISCFTFIDNNSWESKQAVSAYWKQVPEMTSPVEFYRLGGNCVRVLRWAHHFILSTPKCVCLPKTVPALRLLEHKLRCPDHLYHFWPKNQPSLCLQALSLPAWLVPISWSHQYSLSYKRCLYSKDGTIVNPIHHNCNITMLKLEIWV